MNIIKLMTCSIMQTIVVIIICTVCVYVRMGKCVIFLTRTQLTSVCISIWGQTVVSLVPYIRLAIKLTWPFSAPHTGS